MGRASSSRASAKMMLGFFPPSSSATFLNRGAALRAISAPVFVPPVKEMVPIFGCCVIAAPTLVPCPWTMLRTPGGREASRQISERRKAVMGVISEGLATAVFPAAMAGATFQVRRYSGRFQGEMSPAIPRGRRSV